MDQLIVFSVLAKVRLASGRSSILCRYKNCMFNNSMFPRKLQNTSADKDICARYFATRMEI